MSDPYYSAGAILNNGETGHLFVQHHHHYIWIIILVILLVILGVLLILRFTVWKESADQKELQITGTEFAVVSPTAISGSWATVANDADEVTMYVAKTGTKLNFSTDGAPINSSDVAGQSATVNGTTGEVVPTSINPSSGATGATGATGTNGSNVSTTTNFSTTSGNGSSNGNGSNGNGSNGNGSGIRLTLTVDGLTTNASYTAYLVVTNPGFPGYGITQSDSLTPKSTSTQDTGAFHIKVNGQTTGDIVYSPPSPMDGTTPMVGYNYTGQTTAADNLFHHDSNDLLCTLLLSQSSVANVNPDTLCSDLAPNFVLYDPSMSGSSGSGSSISSSMASLTTTNSTGNTALGIKPYESSDDNNPAAQWNYDLSKNTWCLKSNSARCLYLSPFVDLTNPSDNIYEIDITNNPTTWTNVQFSLSSST